MTFWQGKKVLITGHTGFKGSWLSLWLQSLGADLVGLALQPPTTPNLFNLINIADNMTSIIGDIRDFDLVKKIFTNYQPEIVLHLAAQPLVRYSYREPIETYSTNVMGTVNILEAARQSSKVKTIVNITTDKCYENQEWHWGYRENDRLGGHDPYSNSKACAELVTDAYRKSYFNLSSNNHICSQQMSVGIATARAGNVIGGGDWANDRLIPDIIRSCINKQSVAVRNPNALRPWQHVLEPLNGYLMLAENLSKNPDQYSQAWNFGPNDSDVKPVAWIADFITNNWPDQASWFLDDNNHVHEATYLKLDSSKAISELGWQPRWNLEKSLYETVKWYKAFDQGANLRDLTINQIKNFMSFSTNSITTPIKDLVTDI